MMFMLTEVFIIPFFIWFDSPNPNANAIIIILIIYNCIYMRQVERGLKKKEGMTITIGPQAGFEPTSTWLAHKWTKPTNQQAAALTYY